MQCHLQGNNKLYMIIVFLGHYSSSFTGQVTVVINLHSWLSYGWWNWWWVYSLALSIGFVSSFTKCQKLQWLPVFWVCWKCYKSSQYYTWIFCSLWCCVVNLTFGSCQFWAMLSLGWTDVNVRSQEKGNWWELVVKCFQLNNTTSEKKKKSKSLIHLTKNIHIQKRGTRR